MVKRDARDGLRPYAVESPLDREKFLKGRIVKKDFDGRAVTGREVRERAAGDIVGRTADIVLETLVHEKVGPAVQCDRNRRVLEFVPLNFEGSADGGLARIEKLRSHILGIEFVEVLLR